MVERIEIDVEMLALFRCPFCVQGIGHDHGNPFFCSTCDGTAFVFMDRRYLEQFRGDGRRAA